MPYISRFLPERFYVSNDARLSANVFPTKDNTMLVCSYMDDCFVIVSMCDLALCNECLISESRDKIPVKGVVCHTPKFPFWGCE